MYPADVQVAARNRWARIEALQRNRLFVAAYIDARQRWRDGAPTLFPPGTYWLRRFAFVPVAPLARIRDPVAAN